MLPLTTFYRSGAHRSDVYKWDAFVTSWRFYNRAWQPQRHDRLAETSGTLWIHRGALTNQRCSLATGCGITHLNPAEPERMLCPVRQLKLYIRDSESIRGGRQRMFLHWNRSIRDIMRSHISRWIVETVKEAYTQADRQFDRVTAHEVRASWAYNCQVALPDILAAAFWRSSGVFQNSYLRDMACVAEGMSTLGPVVVAQHVVDPGHLHPPP